MYRKERGFSQSGYDGLFPFYQDVDQQTGEDLNPNRRRTFDAGVGDEAMRNPDRPVEAGMTEMQEDPSERKRLAKITDLEKWEIKQVFISHKFRCSGVEDCLDQFSQLCFPPVVQMIAANVLPKEEYPEFDEETGILPKIDDEDGITLSSKEMLPINKSNDMIIYLVCLFSLR